MSRSSTYVGGEFTSIGGGERNGIAAVSAHTGASAAWNATANGDVYALAASGSTLYVGVPSPRSPAARGIISPP